jgi:tricarballylate dehydrogenase
MGAAGLSATVSYADAASAADRTARVAVLERSSETERGGATRYTSSWFRVTEDRRLDPNFVPLMESLSSGLADLDYCRTLEREVGATIAFLEAHDVEYVYFKQPFPNRNTGGGLGMPAGGGLAIVDGLAGIAERAEGIELLYETEAVRLHVSEDGRVDGVVVRGVDGLLRTLGARAVVIASGGFEGNKEMLTQYLGARACDLPVIAPGPGRNRGDGIRMAMRSAPTPPASSTCSTASRSIRGRASRTRSSTPFPTASSSTGTPGGSSTKGDRASTRRSS